jgi:CheY-like chemotaxis protein
VQETLETVGSFLFVEDDPLVVRSVSRLLAPFAAVRAATSKAAALAELGAPRVWCGFIVDLALPDGSGLDVLARALEEHPGTAAIVLTGSAGRRKSKSLCSGKNQHRGSIQFTESFLCEGDRRTDQITERNRASRPRWKEAETGKKTTGPAPAVPDPQSAKPDPKSQRNFTDSESRIMPDGAHKGSFIQAYNAQIAVDSATQVIVAVGVVQEPNDKRQLVPMLEQMKENIGRMPSATSADAGYFSEAAIDKGERMGTELLVPPHRQKHVSPARTPSSTGFTR